MWACMVIHMTHDQWMEEHVELCWRLDDVRTRRDELTRHSEYIPGPVLRKRDRVLDRLELDLLDQLSALVELDRSGVVA